jgi:hypothetical protein
MTQHAEPTGTATAASAEHRSRTRSAVLLVGCRRRLNLGSQIANLGPGLAQIAAPVQIAELWLGNLSENCFAGGLDSEMTLFWGQIHARLKASDRLF